jgi:chromobox protein 1
VAIERASLTTCSEGALDCLNEYFEEIGGRPGGTKKRKSRKSVAAEPTATPVTNKRLKKEKEWSPPSGSWEHDVSYVDTVEEQKDPTTGTKARYAYLVWINQKKTQHPLQHVYQKCPQKMLEYYESHLVFSQNDDDNATNGDNNNVRMNNENDLY